ncbi:hypothetical protein SPF06_00850 [Sinomonas sp. JGH33]|uniref:DUF4926 domain-containing protein n=1 Tax=Sinomonas terricola TaxID=3110330 RepID=A0ABU5T0S7_9MICC|nr:hypothetical protein [Sinomonas sp. JGH33]MEA5453258.1 hypothetical protein [Sinomonas sp. JGH33]
MTAPEVGARVRVAKDKIAAQYPVPNLTGREGTVREVTPSKVGLFRILVDLEDDGRHLTWLHNDELEVIPS